MPRHLTDRIKIAIVFFVHGLMIATWAPHIPYVRDEFGLSEGALGILLLFLAAGAVAAMRLTGAIASRVGADVVTRWTTLAMAGTLLLPLAAPSPLTLAISLAMFGAALGSMDVAMKAVAAEIGTSLGRPVMSSFHGMFSVGAQPRHIAYLHSLHLIRAAQYRPAVAKTTATVAVAVVISYLIVAASEIPQCGVLARFTRRAVRYCGCGAGCSLHAS